MTNLIATTDILGHLADRVRHAAWVAIDTEADSRHCYYEKLCLLQVSHPHGDELVDTLAKVDLAPFFAALHGKELILHGADFDLRILRRTTGFVPGAIFDTDIAARLVGLKQTSLSALAQKFFGVHMEKASQKADWALRPLPEKMLKYAVADTHYLKPLADLLRADLERLGRLEWVRQLCADLIKKSAVTRERDPEKEWRVKGWSHLNRAGLAILRELWHWREKEAQAVDRPPFHILNNERLVAMASLAAHHKEIVRLIPPRMRDERRERLLEAIRRGQQLEPAKHPDFPRRERFRPNPQFVHRFEEIKTARDARAQELGIDPALIASRATMESLANDREANLGNLLPWQRQLLAL